MYLGICTSKNKSNNGDFLERARSGNGKRKGVFMDLSNFGHVGNGITGITALIVAIFSYIQWRKANKIKRAEFLEKIITRLRKDKHISTIMYMVEYKAGWYNKDFHASDKLEKDTDIFLSFINYIVYLKKHKIITNNEFLVISYEVNRVCRDEDMKHYLWNIYQFSKRNNAPCSFQELIDYGMSKGILDSDFITDENKYEKILPIDVKKSIKEQ